MKPLSIVCPKDTVLFETASDCLALAISDLPVAGGLILAAATEALFLPRDTLARLLCHSRAIVGTVREPLAVLCPSSEAEGYFTGDEDAAAFESALRRLAKAVFECGGALLEVTRPASPSARRRCLDAYRIAVLDSLVDRGVDIPCYDGVMISPLAEIGAGTRIQPNTQIRHGTVIGRNADIGPSSVIAGSRIGDGCAVNATQIYDSVLEEEVRIGPFCHVRPNSHLCRGVKIGDFVEVKNSTVGAGTHASHLTYIGDSDVGERVNFGCGVVTVNYNSRAKARCVIGDDAFIGCNTNLVAPVTIGRNAYTAAGSTVTNDVPDEALAIARARQVNKEGWVPAFREKHKK